MESSVIFQATILFNPQNISKKSLLVRKGREWMGLGVAGMIFTSGNLDHSQKFPA